MTKTKIIFWIKKLIIIIFILTSLFWFYKINNSNYEEIRKIQILTIEHPEWLPTKQVAKISSFWFENMRADIYWLNVIQYIWANAIKASYKVYLYKMLDLISALNPYFSHPYKLGLLLLPDYNQRYENLDLKTQKKYKLEAIKIGLKGMKNLCDFKKVNAIIKEHNLEKIWTQKKYKNPCIDSMIPYYLAFDYYFYLNDPISSANYYKVSSANEDSLKWSRILAAIMQWKWGDRKKAFFMFINMAISTSSNKKDIICHKFAQNLQNIWIWIFENKIPLNWNILKKISQLRNKFIWEYDEKKNIKKWECTNYLNKATRQLNLYYIKQANNKFRKDHNWKSALTTEQLYKKWYIKYIPIDYQQSKNYWIIYKYNPKTDKFDTKMWSKD